MTPCPKLHCTWAFALLLAAVLTAASAAASVADEMDEEAACAVAGICGEDAGTEASLHLLQMRGARLHAARRAASEEDARLGGASVGGRLSRDAGKRRAAARRRRRLAPHRALGRGAETRRAAAGRLQSDPLSAHFRRLLTTCSSIGSAPKCMSAITGAASDAFNGLAWHDGLGEVKQMTSEELGDFRNRFETAMEEGSKKVAGKNYIWQKYSTWRDLAMHSYQSMAPIVTKALVDEVNGQGLGWAATYHGSHFKRHSVYHAKQMLGLDTDAEERARLINETKSKEKEDLLEMAGKQEPAGPFDGRDHWPACRSIMRHVRFQTCSNCWSHSTALIAESRTCIETNGTFNGRDAWLSQSYIAACRPDGLSYCRGGSGTVGFRTVNRWGVPTGAADKNSNVDPGATTCYPQILPNLQGVECPAKCSHSSYQRELQSDLFYPRFEPRSLHYNAPQTMYLVKKALMEDGPILIGFLVYADFYTYVSGIYKPVMSKANKKVGGHAVTGMGFGPGYILCINSWGDRWADNGAFKIDPSAVNFGYYLPGKMVGADHEWLPLPVP